MGFNVGIQQPAPRGVVKPSFWAFGNYKLPNAVNPAAPPVATVTLKLYKVTVANGVPTSTQVGADQPADLITCPGRWQWKYGVPTPLDEVTAPSHYRLEAYLDFGGPIDSDSSDPFYVSSGAGENPLDLCTVTKPIGLAVVAPGIPEVKKHDHHCCCHCCKPPTVLKLPLPWNVAFDFIDRWSPEISTAICVVYDMVSGIMVSATPATLSLGRCAAQVLIPVQVGGEKYGYQFFLSDGVSKNILISDPKGLPRNY